MKKYLKVPSVCLYLAVMTLFACQAEKPADFLQQSPAASVMVESRSGERIPNVYIVQFKQDLPELAEPVIPRLERPAPPKGNGNLRIAPTNSHRLSHKIMAKFNLPESRVEKVFDLPGSKGFKLNASPEEIADLEKDSRIAYIEQDQIIAVNLNPGTKGRLIPADDGPSTQTLTYGVQRVGGSKNMSRKRTFAWIVDSGIDTDHEDLNVKVAWGMDFTGNPNWSVEDGLGHGTHVAGIIGAKDNGIGVVGIAAGITLIPIRVLNDQGEGTVSGLINALNYIGWYAKSGDVVNLSLTADKSIALEAAVTALKDNYSVKIVIAAGNNSDLTSIYSPASMEASKLYVAGAIDENDAFCTFSNYGGNIDYVLPGTDIYSTYLNNQYVSMSGTSMAAPHLAGMLLIAGINGDYQIINNGNVSLPFGHSAHIPKWRLD